MIERIKAAGGILLVLIIYELVHRDNRRHWLIETVEDIFLALVVLPGLVLALLVRNRQNPGSGE